MAWVWDTTAGGPNGGVWRDTVSGQRLPGQANKYPTQPAAVPGQTTAPSNGFQTTAPTNITPRSGPTETERLEGEAGKLAPKSYHSSSSAATSGGYSQGSPATRGFTDPAPSNTAKTTPSAFNLNEPGRLETAAPGLLGDVEGVTQQRDMLDDIQKMGQQKDPYSKETRQAIQSSATAGQAGGIGGQAAQAYNEARARRPDLMSSANLGEFYERARMKAMSDINSSAAGYGAYGGSAAMRAGSEAVADLNAQEAKESADYALNRADRMRDYESMLGTMGNAASSAGLTGLRTHGDLIGQAQDDERLRFQDHRDNLIDLAGGASDEGLAVAGAKTGIHQGVESEKITRARTVMEGLIAGVGANESLTDAQMQQIATQLGLSLEEVKLLQEEVIAHRTGDVGDDGIVAI